MDFHAALQRVQQSEAYKNWDKEDAFLAHAFVMQDETGKEEWQLGYYKKQADKMISFVVVEPVAELPPADVVKSDVEIRELKPDEVKITAQEALDIAEKTRSSEYPQALPLKRFFLIQHLESGPVYNITFVTRTFTTLNVKISTKDGTVLHHSNEPLVSFDSGK